jgi:hypothetical protein
VNDAIAERIASALERQVEQFEDAQARRVALEDAHLARLEKNRTDDLALRAQEGADATAANRELLAEIVRLRALVEARAAPPADDAVREDTQ